MAASGKALGECRRIFELGCGAGRMLRWLPEAGARATELWGADVSADHILWCQQHLSPPFRFVTTTSCPHLPFPDGYFDLVYAGSVFTHVSELVDAWLLEIRRVLGAGGRAYLTVLDRHSLEYLRTHPARPLAQRISALPEEMQFWTSDFGMASIGRGFGSLVFYDERFIRERWGRILDVLSITPEAYDLQSAVLLGVARPQARGWECRMSDVTIYHNPVCGKSRGALEILKERGVDHDVVEYLQAPPDRPTLARILDLLAGPPATSYARTNASASSASTPRAT